MKGSIYTMEKFNFIHAMNEIGFEIDKDETLTLFNRSFGKIKVENRDDALKLLRFVSEMTEHNFTIRIMMIEARFWEKVDKKYKTLDDFLNDTCAAKSLEKDLWLKANKVYTAIKTTHKDLEQINKDCSLARCFSLNDLFTVIETFGGKKGWKRFFTDLISLVQSVDPLKRSKAVEWLCDYRDGKKQTVAKVLVNDDNYIDAFKVKFLNADKKAFTDNEATRALEREQNINEHKAYLELNDAIEANDKTVRYNKATEHSLKTLSDALAKFITKTDADAVEKDKIKTDAYDALQTAIDKADKAKQTNDSAIKTLENVLTVLINNERADKALKDARNLTSEVEKLREAVTKGGNKFNEIFKQTLNNDNENGDNAPDTTESNDNNAPDATESVDDKADNEKEAMLKILADAQEMTVDDFLNLIFDNLTDARKKALKERLNG